MLAVATPKPLAYIERRKGPIVWLSYFLSEYVPGPKLSDVLASDELAEQDRLNAVAKVEHVIAKLSASRITHGDLKHTNILITDSGAVLTDLDGMRVSRWNFSWRISGNKDVSAFAQRCSAIAEEH
jgi:tRNA A-37 threonylcarbamoyl transferase component Bud32